MMNMVILFGKIEAITPHNITLKVGNDLTPLIVPQVLMCTMRDYLKIGLPCLVKGRIVMYDNPNIVVEKIILTGTS